MGSVGPVQVTTFQKRDGRFRLVTSTGVIMAEMDKVAILYSQLPDGSVIAHEFGTPRYVMTVHQWRKGEYQRLGMTDMADEMRIAVSDGWTPEELNRARADNAYLSGLLSGTQGTGGPPGETSGGAPAALPDQPQEREPVVLEG